MNTLLGLVNTWAEKLTLKSMNLFGVSQDTIGVVADAFVKKDAAQKVSEEKQNKIDLAKILKYALMMGVAAMILWGASLVIKAVKK